MRGISVGSQIYFVSPWATAWDFCGKPDIFCESVSKCVDLSLAKSRGSQVGFTCF